MFFNISFLYSIYKEFCRSDIGVDLLKIQKTLRTPLAASINNEIAP